MPDDADVLTRPAPPPDLQIRYGPHPDQVADVRLPFGEPAAPVVLVLHGGFWRQRYDRTHTGPQCAGLASAGYVAVAVEYRRVGGAGGWPETFDDVALAVDTLPGLLSDVTDPGPVVLLGHSAGGHLALWAASRGRLPPGSRWVPSGSSTTLRGAVSLAGVADLTTAGRLRLSDGAVEELIGEPADETDRYALADPLRLVPPDVPVTLVHGTADAEVPVELSERYAAAAGGRAELVILPAVGHYPLIDPLSAAWPAVLECLSRMTTADSRPGRNH